MEHDNLPIAVRRTRRSNAGMRDSTTPVPETAYKTPRKTSSSKKTRFSDTALPSSTGLTPMLRRSAIGGAASVQRRRVSMPEPGNTSSSSFWDHGDSDCIRHVRDGRVERRERRGATRDLFTKVEEKHRRAASQAKSEIARLQSQLEARDREIYDLNNATIVIDTERIWELEGQVDALRRDLQQAQKSQQQSWHGSNHTNAYGINSPAANDFDDQTWFNDTDIIVSTPSRRARESFPTPPATSPMMPAIPETPSTGSSRLRHVDVAPTPMTRQQMGVQASLPDPDAQARALELESLQREMGRLTTTLDDYKQMMQRLSQGMPQSNPEVLPDADASPTATFEQQVAELVQNIGEKNALLADMEFAVSALGFPGQDSSEMLRAISLGFRQARLELEYLSPGECSLPLSHHGAEVLDLALTQLRDLARKLQEKEDAIDEYHAEELSLRRQLNDRVSFAERLKGDLSKATALLDEKDTRIHELEIGTDRLKGAVNSYLRDISELERLVERMEAEAPKAEAQDKPSQKDAEPRSDEEQEKHQELIRDLEARVAAATQSASELRDELDVVKASRKKQLADVNKRNGQALALRDARVGELRTEITRINSALSSAHWEIHRLRSERQTVLAENSGLRQVIGKVKSQLEQAKAMNQELEGSSKDAQQDGEEPSRLLSGKLARRRSKRKADSGIGLVDEEAEM